MSDEDDAFDEPDKADEQKETDDFGTLVSLIDQGGLATWLQDKNNKAWLIQTLYEESGAPKPVIRLILKFVVVPIVKKSESTAKSWIKAKTSSGATSLVEKLLARFPEIRTRLERLAKDQAERKKADQDIKQAIEAGMIDESLLQNPLVNQTDKLLLKQLSEASEINVKLDDILAALKLQPDLTIERTNFLGAQPDQLPDHQRLHFAANIIGLQGREDERRNLDQWRDTEALFSWWLVTGSGGVGKSRLAFEWSLDHDTIGWRAGFLRNLPSNIDWTTWQPERPTVIIIDYVQERAQSVGQIIDHLAGRLEGEHALIFPVRILLLERQRHETWWPQIHSRQATVQNSFFGSKRKTDDLLEDLELAELGHEQNLAVLRAIVADKSDLLPPPEQAIALLKEIDTEMRPLFVIMAGLEFRQRGDLRFTQEDLLNSRLEREMDLIWPTGKNLPSTQVNREKNAWILATLTGGLPCEAFKTLHNEHKKLGRILPDFDGYADIPLSTGFQSLIEKSDFGDVLTPLRPDILGEWLALTFAGRIRSPIDEDHLETLVQTAWQTNPSITFYLSTFIGRIAQDFHIRLASNPALWLKSPELNTDYSKLARASLVVNLIARLPDKSIDHKVELFQGIEHFQKEENPLIRLEWGKSAANLIEDLGKGEDLFAAKTVFQDLSKFSNTNTADIASKILFANGTFSLINAHLANNDIVGAQIFLDDLKVLLSKYETEPEIRLAWARSCHNMISGYFKARQFDIASTLLGELKSLSFQHARQPSIRQLWAQSAFNLLTAFAENQRVNAARDLVDELRALAFSHKNEPQIAREWAKGTFNLINACLKTRMLRAARNLLDELQAGFTEHKSEPLIRLAWAKGAVNTINALAIEKEYGAARELMVALREFSLSHSSDSEIRLRCA